MADGCEAREAAEDIDPLSPRAWLDPKPSLEAVEAVEEEEAEEDANDAESADKTERVGWLAVHPPCRPTAPALASASASATAAVSVAPSPRPPPPPHHTTRSPMRMDSLVPRVGNAPEDGAPVVEENGAAVWKKGEWGLKVSGVPGASNGDGRRWVGVRSGGRESDASDVGEGEDAVVEVAAAAGAAAAVATCVRGDDVAPGAAPPDAESSDPSLLRLPALSWLADRKGANGPGSIAAPPTVPEATLAPALAPVGVAANGAKPAASVRGEGSGKTAPLLGPNPTPGSRWALALESAGSEPESVREESGGGGSQPKADDEGGGNPAGRLPPVIGGRPRPNANDGSRRGTPPNPPPPLPPNTTESGQKVGPPADPPTPIPIPIPPPKAPPATPPPPPIDPNRGDEPGRWLWWRSGPAKYGLKVKGEGVGGAVRLAREG